jgi:hypothetical protein
MRRKRIFQKDHFRLIWSPDHWEWFAFLRIVKREHMENRLWYGLERINCDWQLFLHDWMQVKGHFFVGWHDAGIMGACWVTDIEKQTGKFHLCTFPWGSNFFVTMPPRPYSGF